MMVALLVLVIGLQAFAIRIVRFYPIIADSLQIAALSLTIAALIVYVVMDRMKQRRIEALHEQIQAFLQERGTPKFGVSDTMLSLLENDYVQLAEQLLLERENTKNEIKNTAAFLADVSHQLKTPLASLKLYSELQWEQTHDPRIKKQLILIERMEQLIYALLRLEKLRTGTYELHFAPHDLHEMIVGALDEWKRHYPDKRFALHGECLTYRCDDHWLLEALNNIIKNACEHTEKDGHIQVWLERQAGILTIIVEDDGGGVLPEDLEHLFERYYRSKRDDMGQGAGIGLAIAKTVVQKHHGSLCAQNGTEGLRMVMCLPCLEDSLTIT